MPRRVNHVISIIATRNGCHAYGFAQDVLQFPDAVAPLVLKLRRRTVAHAGWMRAGMTADKMSSRAQFPQVGDCHKRSRTDVIGGDEEVAAPSVLLQHLRRVQDRALASIVEGDHE